MSAEEIEQDPDLLLAIALSKSLEEHEHEHEHEHEPEHGEASGMSDDAPLATSGLGTDSAAPHNAELGLRLSIDSLVESADALESPDFSFAPPQPPQPADSSTAKKLRPSAKSRQSSAADLIHGRDRKEFEDCVEKVSSRCKSSQFTTRQIVDDATVLFSKLKKIDTLAPQQYLFFSAIIHSLATTKLNSEVSNDVDQKASFELSNLVIRTCLSWLSNLQASLAPGSKEDSVVKSIQILFLSLSSMAGFDAKKTPLAIVQKKSSILSKMPNFSNINFDTLDANVRPSPESRTVSLRDGQSNPLGQSLLKAFDEGLLQTRKQFSAFQDTVDFPQEAQQAQSEKLDHLAPQESEDGSFLGIEYHSKSESTPSRSSSTLFSHYSNEIRSSLLHNHFTSKLTGLISTFSTQMVAAKDIEDFVESTKFIHAIVLFLYWFDPSNQDAKSILHVLDGVKWMIQIVEMEELAALPSNHDLATVVTSALTDIVRYFGRSHQSASIVMNLRSWIFSKIFDFLPIESKTPTTEFSSLKLKMMLLPLAFDQFKSMKQGSVKPKHEALPDQLFVFETKSGRYDACDSLSKKQLLSQALNRICQKVLSLVNTAICEQPKPSNARADDSMIEDPNSPQSFEEEMFGNLFVQKNEENPPKIVEALSSSAKKVLLQSIQFLESIFDDPGFFVREKINPRLFFRADDIVLYIKTMQLIREDEELGDIKKALRRVGTKIILQSWFHPSFAETVFTSLLDEEKKLWLPDRESLRFIVKLILYQVAVDCVGIIDTCQLVNSTFEAIFQGTIPYDHLDSYIKYETLVLSCFMFDLSPTSEKPQQFSKLLGYFTSSVVPDLRQHLLILLEYMVRSSFDSSQQLAEYLRQSVYEDRLDEPKSSTTLVSQFYTKYTSVDKQNLRRLPINSPRSSGVSAITSPFDVVTGSENRLVTLLKILDLSRNQALKENSTNNHISMDQGSSILQRLIWSISIPLDILHQNMQQIGSCTAGINYIIANIAKAPVSSSESDLNILATLVKYVTALILAHTKGLVDEAAKSNIRLQSVCAPLIVCFQRLIATFANEKFSLPAQSQSVFKTIMQNISEFMVAFLLEYSASYKASVSGFVGLDGYHKDIISLLAKTGAIPKVLLLPTKGILSADRVNHFESLCHDVFSFDNLRSMLPVVANEKTQSVFDQINDAFIFMNVSDPSLASGAINLYMTKGIIDFGIQFVNLNFGLILPELGNKKLLLDLLVDLCTDSFFSFIEQSHQLLHSFIQDSVGEELLKNCVRFQNLENVMDMFIKHGNERSEQKSDDEPAKRFNKGMELALSYSISLMEDIFYNNQSIQTAFYYFLGINDGAPQLLSSQFGLEVPRTQNILALLHFASCNSSNQLRSQIIRIYNNLIGLSITNSEGVSVCFGRVFSKAIQSKENQFFNVLCRDVLFGKTSGEGKDVQDLQQAVTSFTRELLLSENMEIESSPNSSIFQVMTGMLFHVFTECPSLSEPFIRALFEAANSEHRVLILLNSASALLDSVKSTMLTLSDETLSAINALFIGLIPESSPAASIMEVDEGAPKDCCTFVKTGTTHEEQHWYHCYTCKLVVSEGCCSVCAQTCHAGHDVSYAKFSKFYCDCGSNPLRRCKRMTPTASARTYIMPPTLEQVKQILASQTDSASHPKLRHDSLISSVTIRSKILHLFEHAIEVLSTCALENSDTLGNRSRVSFGHVYDSLTCNDDFERKRSSKSGYLETKIPTEPSESKLLKSLLSDQRLGRSLMGFSGDRLVVAENKQLSVYDVTTLYGESTSSTIEKSSLPLLSKAPYKFDPVHLAISPKNQGHIAVAGLSDCLVFVQDGDSDNLKSITVHVGILPSQKEFIQQMFWLPWSQTDLLIATKQAIRIYDLTKDAMSPKFFFTLLDDEIIAVTASRSRTSVAHLIVLGATSLIYYQQLTGLEFNGPSIITSSLEIFQDTTIAYQPSNIYYSSALGVLLIFNKDGDIFSCELSSDYQHILQYSIIKAKAAMSFDQRTPDIISEHPGFPGLLVIHCRKHNILYALKFDRTGVIYSLIKPTGSTTSIEGVALTSPQALKSCLGLLALYDDGSFSRFDSAIPTEIQQVESLTTLGGKDLNQSSTHPINYFETKEDITKKVTFSGHLGKVMSSEETIGRWMQSEEFIVLPSPDSSTVTISYAVPDMVIRGFRVLLNPSSKKHHPSEIRFKDRSIHTRTDYRRWYHLLFTPEESRQISIDGCFTISLTKSADNPGLCSIRVYGSTLSNFEQDCSRQDAKGDMQRPLVPASQWSNVPKLASEKAIITCFEGLKALLRQSESQEISFSEQDLEHLQKSLLSMSTTFSGLPSAPCLLHESTIVLSQAIRDRELFFKTKDLAFLETLRQKLLDSSQQHLSIPYLVQSYEQLIDIVTYSPESFHQFIKGDTRISTRLWELFQSSINEDLCESPYLPIIIRGTVLILVAQASLVSNTGAIVAECIRNLVDLVSSNTEAIRTFATSSIIEYIGKFHSNKQDDLPQELNQVAYFCDGCKKAPITSSRWRCSVCLDFDLCQDCHTTLSEFPGTKHNKTHHMVLSSTSSLPNIQDASMEDIGAATASSDDMDLQEAIKMSLDSGSNVKGTLTNFVDLLLHDFTDKKQKGGVYILPILQLIIHLVKTGAIASESVERCVKIISPPLDSPIFNRDITRSSLFESDMICLQLLQYLPVRDRRGAEKTEIASGLLPSWKVQDIASALIKCNLSHQVVECLSRLITYFSNLNQRQSHDTVASQGGESLIVPQYKFKRNYAPFFTESQCDAIDLFGDYHRMLLESALGVYHNIIRARKTVDSSCHTDEKLDAFVEILCQLIALPQTSFAKPICKRILHSIYKSKEKYYQVRDCGAIKFFLAQIHVIAPQLEAGGMYNLPFEASEKLLFSFNQLLQVAHRRPQNWKFVCFQDASIVPFLFRISDLMVEESVINVLKLLYEAFSSSKDDMELTEPAAGTEKKTNSGANTDTSSATKILRPKSASQESNSSSVLLSNSDVAQKPKSQSSASKGYSGDHSIAWTIDDNQLSRFIDSYMLKVNIESIRVEARRFILALYNRTLSKQQDLLSIMTSKLGSLPAYGKNAAEFFDCYERILMSFGQSDARITGETVVEPLKRILREQNTLLVNHPNSFLYKSLAQYIDFDGFYLESDPCLICNDPEVPFQPSKIDGVKSEIKYVHNAYIIKFNASYVLRSIGLNINDTKKTKQVKLVSVFYSTSSADMTELKNNHSLWKRGAPIHIEQGRPEGKAEFPIPIVASNIKLEFSDFYESASLASEKLHCPRCSTVVTDRHGVCRNCRENAYQCRQCRAIHYGDLHAFLCIDCGYCRHGKFDFSFSVKRNLGADRIFTVEDRKQCLENIEKETKNAHKSYQQLLNYRKPLQKIIHNILDQDSDTPKEINDMITSASRSGSSSSNSRINNKIHAMGTIYHRDCKPNFESLSRSVQMLTSFRRELLRYSLIQSGDHDTHSGSTEKQEGKCFGCAIQFITRSLKLLRAMAKNPTIRANLIQTGILEELLSVTLHQGTKQTRADTRLVITSLIKDDEDATSKVNAILREKILGCIQNPRDVESIWHISNEIHLLSELCLVEDSVWESRLRLVIDIFFCAISKGINSPIITEAVTLPCLKVISQLSVLGPESSIPLEIQDTLNRQPKVSYAKWKDGSFRFSDWADNSTTTSTGKPPEKASPSTSSHETSLSPSVRYMVRKCVRTWKQMAGFIKVEPAMPPFIKGSWIKKLLLNPVSQLVRQETRAFIEILYRASSVRKLRFLDLLSSMLEHTSSAGEASAEYFELYNQLLTDEHKSYLIVKGIIPKLLAAVGIETTRISAMETSFSTDMSQGFVLKNLVQLINTFVENPLVLNKFKEGKLLEIVLDSYLHLRGLVVQKTKLTDDASDLLLKLLKKCFGDSDEDKKKYLVTCTSALDKHWKGATGLFILEQMSLTIRPVKPEPVYMLVLNKASSQEEFIPGSMGRNPYSSKDVGPLMRDVKNKICVDLDMKGFLDSDNGIELLVNNNIINLGLSIKQVYEKVWLPSRSESDRKSLPPMVVVYRLQGLEGEARETIIETIEEQQDAERDPEEEFALTSVMREKGALGFMFNWLNHINNFELHRETVTLLLMILYYCGKLQLNRQAMLKLGATSALFVKLDQIFQSDSASALSQNILQLIAVLVEEANLVHKSDEMKDSEEIVVVETTHLPMILEKLTSPVLQSNAKINHILSRVLPFLTYGDLHLMKLFVDFFQPYMNLQEFDSSEQPEQSRVYYLTCLKTALSMISNDHNGRLLKSYILETGVTQSFVAYLKELFPPELAKDSPHWSTSVAKQSVTYVLEFLTGLVRGHNPGQELVIASGIVRTLCKLETLPTGNKNIGPLSESLLNAVMENNTTAKDHILAEREYLKQERKKASQAIRDKMIRDLAGPSSSSKEGGPTGFNFDELEEEKGHECIVCQEGYTIKPNLPLGFYTFTKRAQLSGHLHSGTGQAPARGKAENGYCTVTYFKVIHYACHEKDTKAKKNQRQPMEEWEGAVLRNSNTACNSLFPIYGPQLAVEVYGKEVERFWQLLNNVARVSNGSRVRYLMHDLRLLLLRLVNGESYSQDTRGGGKESNFMMIPHVMSMGLYLLDQSPSVRVALQTALNQATAADIAKWKDLCAVADNPSYMLVLSLLLYSNSDWEANRFTLFKQVILGRLLEPLDESMTASQKAKNAMLLFSIVDGLQKLIKKGLPAGSINDSETNSPWILALKEKLKVEEDTIQEGIKELLTSYDEEIQPMEEPDEFLDFLGLIAQASQDGMSGEELVDYLFAASQ